MVPCIEASNPIKFHPNYSYSSKYLQVGFACTKGWLDDGDVRDGMIAKTFFPMFLSLNLHIWICLPSYGRCLFNARVFEWRPALCILRSLRWAWWWWLDFRLFSTASMQCDHPTAAIWLVLYYLCVVVQSLTLGQPIS